MLAARQVIKIPDETIRPPKPKYVVCVDYESGWFYRINTKKWDPSVFIPRDPNHVFLDHDSYLECGDPLEVDDYVIDSSIQKYGIIGSIHKSHCAEIIDLLVKARTLRDSDKQKIIFSLENS